MFYIFLSIIRSYVSVSASLIIIIIIIIIIIKRRRRRRNSHLYNAFSIYSALYSAFSLKV